MPADTYRAIKEDILSQKHVLLEVEELDDFVEPKTECLLRTLIQAEMKSRAEERGILV